MTVIKEPPWLVAAVDQRVALMVESGVGKVAKDYGFVMASLTERQLNQSEETWERTCDSCGAFTAKGTNFYTGTCGRILENKVQVVIVFGICAGCYERQEQP